MSASPPRESRANGPQFSPPPDAPGFKLLYIVGAGRSGTTILSRILSGVDGFVFTGEPYYLWQEGFVENRRCGCGEPFDSCPFWTEVVARMEATTGELLPEEMIRLRARLARTRHLPGLGVPSVRSRLLRTEAGSRYLEVLEALYRAIRDVASARVLVDSSKLPSYGLLLRALPGVDFRILHLVRDPRAVAHSWQRKRVNPASGRPFGRIHPVRSAWIWGLWNTAAELMPRRTEGSTGAYLRLRYEDFVSRPEDALRRILELVDEDRRPVCLEGAGVHIAPGHSMGGNPARFERGPIVLRPDTRWIDRLPAHHRRIVELLTWPLMLRYGYPLRRRDRPDRPDALC